MALGKIKQKSNTNKNKVKEEAQPSSTQPLDAKFDTMMETMEKLMERLEVGDRAWGVQQHESQIRNPNFSVPRFPQIRQVDQKNPIDNQARPPF